MVCNVSVAPLRLRVSSVVTMAIKKRNQKTSKPRISDADCLIPPRSRTCLIPARSAKVSNWQSFKRRTTILLTTLQIAQPNKMIAMAKKILGKKIAILVIKASQKPVTVTTGFMLSSLTANSLEDCPKIGTGAGNVKPLLEKGKRSTPLESSDFTHYS